jgi:hypothetical protein
VRLLSASRPSRGGKRPGRPRRYGPEVAAAARIVYQAAGGIGAKRLQPFLPELMDRLIACGELLPRPQTVQLLRAASAATLERLLLPDRLVTRNRARSLTKPGTLLRKRIPIRTFGAWDDLRPGFLEMDTVAHCGETLAGFHLWTVTAVDVATGWIDMDVVWGKTQVRVGAAIDRIRRRLPVPLLGLDCDNGSEFINKGLLAYCDAHHISFTRSRPHRSNDNAHIEQKNGAVVRRLVGYGRYMTAAAFTQLQLVYSLARLHANFFQPVRKLSAKHRDGAKSIRYYDAARTPYQRMLEHDGISPARRVVLERLYLSLHPLRLSRQIEAETATLLRLASRPGDPISSWIVGNRSSEATSLAR